MKADLHAIAGWTQILKLRMRHDVVPRAVVLRCMGLFGDDVPEHLMAVGPGAGRDAWRVMAVSGRLIGEVTCTPGADNVFVTNVQEDPAPEGAAEFTSWALRIEDVIEVSLLPTDNADPTVWATSADDAPIRTVWQLRFTTGRVVVLPYPGDADATQDAAAEGIAGALLAAMRAGR
jgi:hypothetical protein